MKTTQVLTFLLVAASITAGAVERYVSLSGGHVPPFTSWADAATNIQAAIDAADAGDVIWVTNGVYATGGKVMAGDLTNRVALYKALTVQSVNGPFVTTIRGNGTNAGTSAVRCAWLTNGATLKGFTLREGSTRADAVNDNLGKGAGVLCWGNGAVVANCVITMNKSYWGGSAAIRGTLRNCLICKNPSDVTGATGVLLQANLLNCTIVNNGSNASPAIYSCAVTNSIVANNASDLNSGTFACCCTSFTASSPGNIKAIPSLLPDGIHIANDSPCRAAGTNFTVGVDIDGQAWANPPSIGCDQWSSAPQFGSPSTFKVDDPFGAFNVFVFTAGQDPMTYYWTKDGVSLADGIH